MPRANLSRAAVVDAAARLADRDGAAAVTVSSVAREVGVKPASLYEHVAGLSALLDGAHVLALGELAAAVANAVAGLAGADALRAFADAHRAYATAHPGRWELLQRVASPSTVASSEAARVGSLTLATLRGYPMPDDQRVHAARFVGATINGYLALTRNDAFSHRAEPTGASWRAAVDALDRALSTWPTERIHPSDPENTA